MDEKEEKYPSTSVHSARVKKREKKIDIKTVTVCAKLEKEQKKAKHNTLSISSRERRKIKLVYININSKLVEQQQIGNTKTGKVVLIKFVVEQL